MDESNQREEIDQNEDCFVDALDEFPFYDFDVTKQSNESISDSTLCESSPVSSPVSALRRRSNSKDFNAESSSISSDITHTHDGKTRYPAKRYKLYRDLKENEKNLETIESTWLTRDGLDSVGFANGVIEDDQKTGSIANDQLEDSSSANFFVFFAELVIKAIGFQVNLFVKFVTLPIWAVYNSYMLVVDPFGVVRHGRGFLLQKLFYLWKLISGLISPSIGDWFEDQDKIWKLLLRFGYASFWSVYVGIVLCGLLVFSMLASGFLMSYMVENPIEIKEELIFDYTQNSPVAFVPVMSCAGVGCGLICEEKSLGPRVIPPYHKLRLNIELTLPESGYNRNLGIFQVRVEFLSMDGKTLASKRQPCMLNYQSEPIRVFLTFFKMVPLITGYMSESQTIKVKIRGITEGDVPTSCIKVILEQRAEYRPGAGIPEIYHASARLESALPLFKRILSSWKRTVFVWISMTFFIVELLFALICCRPLIMPRTRKRDVPAPCNSTPRRFTELS